MRRTLIGALSALLLVASSVWAQTVTVVPPVLNPITLPQGRLTLTTATPVMTATAAAQTTAFYTPYIGNNVPIFDGTNFNPTACAETSNISTNSATGSAGPAVVGASKVNDFFLWSNAGACTLTRGPDWTNTTTRSAGTALVRQNGVWLNNATITNGPAASRGTYVGTIASNAGSTWDYIFGASASGGTAAVFNVWNTNNRVSTATNVIDSGASYTYTTATIRQARASAGNQASFVIGLNEDPVSAGYAVSFNSAAAVGGLMKAGLGLDSTTTFTNQLLIFDAQVAAAEVSGLAISGIFQPGIGVHTISANELGDGANANTFNQNSLNVLSMTLRN